MGAPPPIDISDRRTVDVAIWIILIGLFGLFGGSAKLLYYWRPTPWTRVLGSLMVSVFASWIVGLVAWRFLADSPPFLLALTGAAAWVGSEIVDRLARRLAYLVYDMVPPPELPPKQDGPDET